MVPPPPGRPPPAKAGPGAGRGRGPGRPGSVSPPAAPQAVPALASSGAQGRAERRRGGVSGGVGGLGAGPLPRDQRQGIPGSPPREPEGTPIGVPGAAAGLLPWGLSPEVISGPFAQRQGMGGHNPLPQGPGLATGSPPHTHTHTLRGTRVAARCCHGHQGSAGPFPRRSAPGAMADSLPQGPEEAMGGLPRGPG